MSEATATSAAPARTRAPRRSPTELTFHLDEELVERRTVGEPGWLAADRRAALARFGELPIETNRLYTPYVDLRGADLSDVRASEPAPTATRTADLPDGVGALIQLSDAGSPRVALAPSLHEAGVTVEPLAAFISRDPEAARRLLAETGALPDDDKLAQLTRAGWSHGVVVRVPDGARVEAPIVIRWSTGVGGQAFLSRTIVELGDGAAASLVEEIGPSESPGTGPSLFTGTLEVRLGRGADLAVASLQELGPETVAFQHRDAAIGEGASLRWALAQLGGRLVRSRVDNRLVGDRSEVEQIEIVFGAQDQLFDLTSYTRHVGRDTTGNLLSKGALLDRSRSYMKGLIEIERSAIGTDSYLGEFGMNLSKAARAVAIPSLEIDQPDCRRAMHSSSVGPIDEAQVFYLRSRGIPEDEARKFIVLGFLEPVVSRVPLASAQDRLRELLDAKWESGVRPADVAA